jgi:hypothetical protein
MRIGETLVEEVSLPSFVELLAAGETFSFSRWNDAQWNMILGKEEGRTGDGHVYSKEIGDALRAVILDRPEYMVGMQGLSLRLRLGERVQEWIEETGLEDLRWCNADVFHYASMANVMCPLIEQLKKLKVVVVGPQQMKLLPFASHFVPIPPTDAYYDRRRIIDQTARILRKQKGPIVVSVSAGWTANLLISELHPVFGHKASFVDFGSVWDPYVGVHSRGYMRESDFKI